jgi:hypothetical protein
MTPPIQLRRRLSPIAGLSLCLISSCLLPVGAKAAGFSGSFAPSNWILTNTNPDETLGSSEYTCTALQVACVENIDPSTGSVDVVGSVSGQLGGGEALNFPRTTTWSLTNTGPNALISFDWVLNTSGGMNQSASYLVDLVNIVLSSADASGSIQSLLLATGNSFGFRITTFDNVGELGILSIANFNATSSSSPTTSVPGPLPLVGGAAALAFSRRLRSLSVTRGRESLGDIHPR